MELGWSAQQVMITCPGWAHMQRDRLHFMVTAMQRCASQIRIKECTELDDSADARAHEG